MTRRRPWGLVLLVLQLTCTQALAGSPAGSLGPPAAEPTLTDVETQAIRFCQSFSKTAQDHVLDCVRMGLELQRLVHDNAEFVSRVASMDSRPVREGCVLALEHAFEPLMACGGTPEVEVALAELAALEDASPTPAAHQGTSANIDGQLKRAAAFCDAYALAVRGPESVENTAEGSRCAALASRISAVNTEYRDVLESVSAQAEHMTELQRQTLNAAVLRCIEAAMTIPKDCAELPALGGSK